VIADEMALPMPSLPQSGLKSIPSGLRSPPGKIPAEARRSRVEESRQARAKTPRTLNVYENTGSYRFFRAFRWPALRLRILKTKGLSQSCIGYKNDEKKGC
jgi:hypothetical protein